MARALLLYRRPLGRRYYLTVGPRGPRLGRRLGRFTLSAGASGLRLGVRLVRGLYAIVRP